MGKEVVQNKRIIATSFDGALIDSEEAIPMTTVLAIDACRSLGHRFVITSGRVPTSILAYNQDFNFLDYVVGCNGAYIYDNTAEKVIYKMPIPKQVVRNIKQTFESFSILYFCTPDCWHLYVSTIYQEKKDKVMKSEIKDFNRFLSKNKNHIYKIELHFTSEERAREALKMMKKLKLEVNFNLQVFSHAYIIEVVSRGVDKYEALRIIAKREKVKMKDVVAIGYGYNDIRMVKRAGYGVAVANSCSEVKEVSQEVTTSNDNLGVEKILEKVSQIN